MGACKTTDPVYLPILDSLGSLLAEDVVSDSDLPGFDKSPLDGYAVRSRDTRSASDESPVLLQKIGFLPAGHLTDKVIGKGETIRLMTGSKIPEGADVVIAFEKVELIDNRVKITRPYPAGTNIIKKGEDLKSGTRVFNRGMVLNPAEIGILAALGRCFIKVYRRPRVAILSTGDELLELQEPLEEGKVRNSNSYFIFSLAKRLGAEPCLLGICGDQVEAIKNQLKPALAWADLVITTGGVSVGDYDLVKDAFSELGAEMLLWRVKMKPGSPMAVARYRDKLLIGLSGNPAAAYITFELFVRPVLLRMMGRKDYKPVEVKSILQDGFPKVSKNDRLIRAKTVYREGRFITFLPEKHSSGTISTLSATNSLVQIVGGKGPYEAGEEVVAYLLHL
mgnify:CR=1 FL=1